MPNSIHKQILDKVVTTLQGDSDLSAISDSNIVVATDRRVIEEILPNLPGILVLPTESERIDIGRGTNARDDISYPAGVVILDGKVDDPLDTAADFDTKLHWRQLVIDNFISKRVTGITGADVYNCEVVPRAIIEIPMLQARNLWSSFISLIFRSRVTRS